MIKHFQISIDDDLLSRIDDWREEQAHTPTQSEAMQQLIKIALTRLDENLGIKLNKPNKLIIWMLSEILKNIKTDNDTNNTNNITQEAILRGHLWALDS